MYREVGDLLFIITKYFKTVYTIHNGKGIAKGLRIHVNNQIDAQFFYVYFYSVHVSGSHVPIIRRIIVSV